MAYCGKGTNPSCGYNHKGQRVRSCAKHRRAKTTATEGKKIKAAEPKRPYRDQKKYYKKYKTLEYVRGKARRGSKAAAALLPGLVERQKREKAKAKAKDKVKAAIKSVKPARSKVAKIGKARGAAAHLKKRRRADLQPHQIAPTVPLPKIVKKEKKEDAAISAPETAAS